MLAEGNEKELDITEEGYPMVAVVKEAIAQCDWYRDIVYYLQNLSCLGHLLDHRKRALKLKVSKYCFVDIAVDDGWIQGLGWKNLDGVILNCVEPPKAEELMKEFHEGLCGGHHVASTTTHKTMRSGYYWPSIFKDVYKYIRSCQPCQLFTGKQKLAALPLQPVIIEAPFQQWGLDFIGKFRENSSNGHKWILTATDYFTKWVEAIPTKRSTAQVIIDFLEDRIITRYEDVLWQTIQMEEAYLQTRDRRKNKRRLIYKQEIEEKS